MAKYLLPIEIPDGWEVADVLYGSTAKSEMRSSGHGRIEPQPAIHIKKIGVATEPKRRIEIGHPVTKDIAVVPDDRVRFVSADDRTMFEIRFSGDNGIEIRGCDCYRVGDVLYDHCISVEPCGSTEMQWS